MEILPLTYDKYFKKTFSNLDIAKQFLEDFLDTEIETLEILDKDINITNEARELRFDCRVKSNAQHFIVEMQQWYKYDAVKRFYLYHCANTVLQLENMPNSVRMVRNRQTGEYYEKEVKDYSTLKPAITIVWFVDDSFATKREVLVFDSSFSTKDFFDNKDIWNKAELSTDEGIDRLFAEREEIQTIQKHDHKGMNFLPENKMFFALQKQILKKNKNSRYFPWFSFAEKSRNKNNVISDFDDFRENEIFDKLMRLLSVKFVKEVNEIKEAADYCDHNEAYLKQVDADTEKGYNMASEKFIEESQQNRQELRQKDAAIQQNKQELQQNKQELQQKDEAIQQYLRQMFANILNF
jgi:hypothetical protein